MLEVRGLHAAYGACQVLHGIDLVLQPGELVAVLGRNGAGRSTLARALMGLLPSTGHVAWRGRALHGLAPFERAQAGLGYVPESRDVFPHLTVQQNLLLGCLRRARPAAWSFADMYRMFPQLAQRQQTPAGVLSGGEQQMLTLCRTLMGDPEVVLIDEPTEGLAPMLVEQVALCIQALRERGVAVLLIEQKRAMALELASRCLVLGQGRVVFEGSPADLQRQPAVQREWLDVDRPAAGVRVS